MVYAEGGDGHGNGQFEVVRRRREGESGRLRIGCAGALTQVEGEPEHQDEVNEQRKSDPQDVEGKLKDPIPPPRQGEERLRKARNGCVNARCSTSSPGVGSEDEVRQRLFIHAHPETWLIGQGVFTRLGSKGVGVELVRIVEAIAPVFERQ